MNSEQTDIPVDIPWHEPPFCFVAEEQRPLLQQSAQLLRYNMGDLISEQPLFYDMFWVMSGNVRLKDDQGTKIALLNQGDWFGTLITPPVAIKVTASTGGATLLGWNVDLWINLDSLELQDFWQEQQARYHSPATSPYLYLHSTNTAAACLAMISEALGSHVTLAELQPQLYQQSPPTLMAAAENIGLHLRCVQMRWEDLAQYSLPALLRGTQDEWAVLYDVRAEQAIIADPLSQERACTSIGREILEADWGHELWLVTPIAKQEKFNLSWFLPVVWRYRVLLFEVLFASLVLQLLGLATPILTQVIIDKAMVHESFSTLDVMAIGLLGVTIFQTVLGVIRLFIFSHTANRIDLELSARLFQHLLRLPLRYFETRRVGDTIARVQELEDIRQFLTGTSLTVVIDSLFSIVCLILMFSYNVTLSWVALGVIPLFAGLTLFGTPLLRKWLNETFNRGADSQSFLVETVTGVHAVKAHAAEYSARRRWEGLFARYIRMSFKASTASNIAGNIGDFLTNFSYLLILWVGARLVISRQLTVGELVAFQMLSGKVTGPLLRLIQLWQDFQQVLLSVDRLGDILNEPPEAAVGSGVVLSELKGKIEFENVSFGYKAGQKLTLKEASFIVEPGWFVGIVGRSGSGKSTLSKLLQRLYEPESGQIKIDGKNLDKIEITSLRQKTGVVLQDDFLFNTSIFENITFGYSEITQEKVEKAAQAAAAHDFITNQPDGYQTKVGERGVNLSGGQRQRITLARAFLTRSPILILDEATSSLDSETEQQVLRNIREEFKESTIFMITHRFAPLESAKLILVMDDGMIVQRGTHEDLLQQSGVYRELYLKQRAES
jgi:ATP-binding cassette, subfamily B, bacterial